MGPCPCAYRPFVCNDMTNEINEMNSGRVLTCLRCELWLLWLERTVTLMISPPDLWLMEGNQWRWDRIFVRRLLPMNRKKIKSPSSRMEALSVRPRICSPLEWRDNLNIRNTLTSRMTRKMASDMAWLLLRSCGVGSRRTPLTLFSSSAKTVANVMK